MKPIYWVALTLLGSTSLASAFFYLLHLGSNEPVPLARARSLFHWSKVVLLGSFNVWIFSRVIDAIRALP